MSAVQLLREAARRGPVALRGRGRLEGRHPYGPQGDSAACHTRAAQPRGPRPEAWACSEALFVNAMVTSTALCKGFSFDATRAAWCFAINVRELMPIDPIIHSGPPWPPQVIVADGDPESWELDGIVWNTK